MVAVMCFLEILMNGGDTITLSKYGTNFDDRHQDSSLSVNVDYDYTTRSSTKQINLSKGQSQDEARDWIFMLHRIGQNSKFLA